MEVGSNEKKVCPNCGEIIELDYIHCKSCGFKLEVYEPNKIEIATTLKKSRNYALCCCFTTGIIVTIFALILGVTLGEITSAAILGVAIIWIIILVSTIPILLVYKRPSKIRTFSISDKSIRIRIPNKTPFNIDWDQIEAVHVKKKVTGRSRLGPSKFTPMHVYYDLAFITTNGSKEGYRIEFTRDFPKKTCKKIKSLLEQYANNLNKGYEFKKSFWS
ncbi:MAG: hypothetical protein ACFE9T_00730 [Promethearchaeota archaeon]